MKASFLFAINLAILSCVIDSSVVYAVAIDDFTTGPAMLVRENGVAVVLDQNDLDPQSVIGGQRSLVLGEFYSDGQTLLIDTDDSQLVLTPSSPADLAGLDLSYGSVINPLNVDLTQDGHDALVMEVAPARSCQWLEVGSIRTDGTVVDDSKGLSSFYDGEKVTIPFTEFGDVDFTDVAYLNVTFCRSQAVTLSGIYTVPEPETHVWVCGVVFASLIIRGRYGIKKR